MDINYSYHLIIPISVNGEPTLQYNYLIGREKPLQVPQHFPNTT